MRNLLALIASAGLVGCVGSVDPPIIDDGSGTPEVDNPAQNDLAPAKQLFDSNVYPIFAAKCSAGVCHGEAGTGGSITKFVAADAANGWTVATNYTAVVGGYTEAAPVLTLIQAGHKGVTYEQAEKDKITAWLAKELELRQGQPSQPQQPGGETLSAAADRVMSKFAGCMTLTNFNTANMGQAWGALQAQNNQECENCHANGGEGFIANRQGNPGNPMFTAISTRKMHFLQYFTVDLTQGAAQAKVIVNQVSFRGVALGQDPHREHPRFNPDNNQGLTALKAFYETTTQKVNAPQGDPNFCEPKPLSNL